AGRPDVDVVGVQAVGAAAFPPSLAGGRPVTLDALVTMADGIAVPRPGDLPFEVVRERGALVRTVTEEDLSRALLLVAERAKMLVEPAGAAGVAALVAGDEPVRTPAVVV